MIGGCDPKGTCGQSNVQIYNPATRQRPAAASYPIPVSHLGCGVIAGKIYSASGVGHLPTSATRAGYAYDPAANTWTPIANVPADLFGGAYGAADRKLLISGGSPARAPR